MTSLFTGKMNGSDSYNLAVMLWERIREIDDDRLDDVLSPSFTREHVKMLREIIVIKNEQLLGPPVETSLEEPCGVCLEKEGVFHGLPCGHLYHKDCIRNWLNTNPTCPACRKKTSWIPTLPQGKISGVGDEGNTEAPGAQGHIE